jgi:hypothetical protein
MQGAVGLSFTLNHPAQPLLPSRQKNIDNTSILATVRDLFFNRRGAESTESIKKRLIIYSFKAGRE